MVRRVRGRNFAHRSARPPDEAPAAWRIYARANGAKIPGSDRYVYQTQDGTVWAVNRTSLGGVYRFEGRQWTEVEVAGNSRHYALTEAAGALWVGAALDKLYAYRPDAREGEAERWVEYGPPAVPTQGIINYLLPTRDGALWLVDSNYKVWRVDLGTQSWQTYEDIIYACTDGDGAHWFIERERAVVRHDPRTDTWMRYGVADGMMDKPRQLLLARDGALWAAGGHGGRAATARFDGARWTREIHPDLAEKTTTPRRPMYRPTATCGWVPAGAASSGAMPRRVPGPITASRTGWSAGRSTG